MVFTETELPQPNRYRIGTYAKFIGFSLFGILFFFTPITFRETNSIPLDHLITFINSALPQAGPLFALCIVVIGGLLPWFDKTYQKGAVAFVVSIFRTLGVPTALMAFFHIGPEWLLDPDLLPFVWEKIVVAVTVIVAMGSLFLTFIIAFGFLEFIGMIMKPILRPLYNVPGKAAVDAVASFVGSCSVAIYLTNKLYNANIYTNKEASIIITGFSTVSATFMIIVAKTAGFMDIWSFYENPAEYPAIYGGDECGAGVRGMQSPSLPFIMPRFLKRGSLLFLHFDHHICGYGDCCQDVAN